MTANEIAQMVRTEPYHTNLNKNVIADFIDQQADLLKKYEKRNVELQTKITKLLDRIAELEKQLEEKNKPPTKVDTLMESQARKFWGSLDNQCHGYTTPQTKPLNNEQIIEIFNQIWVAGGNTNGVMHRFARAIEEAHGIK